MKRRGAAAGGLILTMGFGGMPPKAKKEKAKKEKKPKAEGAKGGKRKKKRSESYSIYIYKVLKQVHPTHLRHLRQDLQRGRQARALQQEGKHAVSEGPKAVTKYTSSSRPDISLIEKTLPPCARGAPHLGMAEASVNFHFFSISLFRRCNPTFSNHFSRRS